MKENKLREIISEEIKKSLTVKVQYERFNKDKGMMELKNENVFLPEWWIRYLPEFMGSLRGLQSDVNKANNKIISTSAGINSIARILIDMENGVKSFVDMSNKIQERLDNIEVMKIE